MIIIIIIIIIVNNNNNNNNNNNRLYLLRVSHNSKRWKTSGPHLNIYRIKVRCKTLKTKRDSQICTDNIKKTKMRDAKILLS